MTDKYPDHYILDYDINDFKIYINSRDYFPSKLPKINITTDYNKADWDDNESYYQVCFAVYCASYCCGVSIEHLTPSEDVHPIITSLIRFHLYFTVRRLIRRMQGGEKMSTISTEFSAGKFYRNIEHIRRDMIYRTRGGVVYQLFPSSLQSDYKRYIPVTSNGLTKIGIQYINESIEAFIYSILGSQARTKQSIYSNRASACKSIDSHIDGKQNIWFKGKDIALALEYKDTDQTIRKNVYEEDKKTIPVHQTGRDHWHIFINESGLYSLLLKSKLPEAKKFKRWVTSEVLPSIRKYGYYRTFNNPNSLAFKIEDEYNLHTKVVQFIRRFYPQILMTVGLGKNQDTKDKRIKSFKKGYMKGQPDLKIQNLHKHYNGLCIEFKTPHNTGGISDHQKKLIERYEENGCKCIVSNDYDLITKELDDYMDDILIRCKYCRRKFISKKTLSRHVKYFHRIFE